MNIQAKQSRRTGLILLCLFFILSSILTAYGRNNFRLDPQVIEQVQQRYGEFAKRRLLAWQDLIAEDESTTDLEKLEKVNAFFNQLEFISDKNQWRSEDYWATPVEFLASNGGDCEDFSLAKYFTLKKIGVDERKLNLTYVKSLGLQQAHMVLTYYQSPQAEPLVLDNLVADIKPASHRTDLLPVYSFNGTGLWIAKSRGRGQLVGDSERLQRWQDLLQRIPEGLN